MSHSKTATTQFVPPAPTPLPVKTLQGLSFSIHESSGHTSEPWALSLLGGEQDQDVVRIHRRETREGTLRRVSPPWPPVCTLTGVSGITPSTLTCSLCVCLSFFTCEKKISRERPGRRLSHEILEQPLVPDPKELSGTVVKTHDRIRNTEKGDG